jgi:hypothetical protein
MRKSRDVGPDAHVADVANLMIWENLRDIVPFWLGRTMILSVNFTPRQESAGGGRRSLHAYMM